MQDHPRVASTRALRLGVAGPVGTGKSSLIAALCRSLGAELRIGAVTNDIYTDEDARFLRSTGVLPAMVQVPTRPSTRARWHRTATVTGLSYGSSVSSSSFSLSRSSFSGWW